MRFAALTVEFSQTPAYTSAPDDVVGIHARLLIYACRLEAGGKILDCRRWDDAAWMRGPGVTKSKIARVVAAKLAAWNGRDLLVGGYDLPSEHAVKTKRENGKNHVAKGAKNGESRDSGGVTSNLQDDRPVSGGSTVAEPLFSSSLLPSPPVQTDQIGSQKEGPSAGPPSAPPPREPLRLVQPEVKAKTPRKASKPSTPPAYVFRVWKDGEPREHGMQEATVQRLEASNVGEPVRELLAKASNRLLQPDAPRIPPEGLMRHLESTYLKRGLYPDKSRTNGTPKRSPCVRAEGEEHVSNPDADMFA